MIIKFIIPGVPVAKARARITKAGFAYTPAKTLQWENWIKFVAYKHKPKILLDCPLEIDTIFYLPKPKSRKKHKYPDVKPDGDNLEKSIFDAMESIMYTNDSRIVKKSFIKLYDENPRVEITIKPLE